MKRTFVAAAVLALAASAVLAQGPGTGQGPGKGPGFGFGPRNTSGWSLMTPQERTEHRSKMMSFKTYEECKAYQDEHHKQMVSRAQEKGRPVPAAPRGNMCDRMKQAGRFS